MDFQQRLANPRERVYLPELFAEVVKQKSTKAKSDLLTAYAKKTSRNQALLKRCGCYCNGKLNTTPITKHTIKTINSRCWPVL